MKNIIQIFKNDLLRIHKNVIAMIVIMGITVIPTLYAWFNIAASWDPYGNTGNLKVAVASNDEGYKGELLPVNLNLGDDVISELQGNKQLNWVFTDAKDAKKGVQSGKYYAAIVIPEDFSGISGKELSHQEVQAVADQRSAEFERLVTKIIEKM